MQTFALMVTATRSVNLELQPSKIQVWSASCPDPIPPELRDKVKTTQRFQRIARLPISMKESTRRRCTISCPCMLVQPASTCSA